MTEMHECVWSAFNEAGLLCCPVCSTVAENQPFKQPETCETCETCGGRKEIIATIEVPGVGPVEHTELCHCHSLGPAQPAPKHGAASEPVEPEFRQMVEQTLDRTYDYGLKKYGVPLYTFDGRDQDFDEEWASAGRYHRKAIKERNHLAELLRRAYPLLCTADLLHDEDMQRIDLVEDIEAALEGLVEVERG